MKNSATVMDLFNRGLLTEEQRDWFLAKENPDLCQKFWWYDDNGQVNSLTGFLVDACKAGNLELVRYLLTSSDLVHHADVDALGGGAITNAIQYGHFDILKYLMTSKELKKNATQGFPDALIMACCTGNLEIVRYLLTSPDLKKKANIHAKNDGALLFACWAEQLHIIDYLLFSPELKEHIDIHAHDEKVFRTACKDRRNKPSTLRHLIFNVEIDRTPAIEELLKKPAYKTIKQMFKKRELNKNLNKNLPVNPGDKKVNKI